MKTNNLGKPSFENEKFKFWQVSEKEKEKVPEAIIQIDLKKEKMFESRVYPAPFGIDLKLLSKQNLKTGQIEGVAILQRGDEKTILGYRSFQDENEYRRNIKNFELELSLLVPIDPKKVLITTSAEFEKILERIKEKREK